MRLVFVFIGLFLAETGCVIQDPPGSAIRACAGDEVVIICNSPYNSVLWKWQNETVGCAEYAVYGIDASEITPNVPVDFPGVPGVTITLLTVASEGRGSINSSLQFIVSEEFVEARVTCNNQDYRDIVHTAECMLRATSIGVGNVVFDMNTTSFNLMWTTNMAYNSSYFITLSANSENEMNISTNEAKDSTMPEQVRTEAGNMSQGSRYDSKNILLVGGMSVLLVVAIVSIGCAVIIMIKKQKSSKESKLARPEDEPVEYSHFQFHCQPVTTTCPDVYGTLNGDFPTESQPKPTAMQMEEYSTLNQPYPHKSPYVRDDYDYASIRYSSNVNTAKGAGEVEYSELGCSTSRSKMELVKSHGAEHNNNTETEDSQADLLLNLDTMLIELKHIAADWKKLGGHLGFSDSDMEIFQHATQGVDFDCLVELFEAWLKKTKKPTWRIVADALKSMGEEDLAQEILNIYKTGQLPDKEHKSGFTNITFDCMEKSDELPPPVPPQNF